MITKFLLCNIESYTIVGDEILFNGNSTYDYSVTANSNEASVYYLSKNAILLYFPIETK